MRTGRPKVALILTEDERQRLDSVAHRSRSAPVGVHGEFQNSRAFFAELFPRTFCTFRREFPSFRLQAAAIEQPPVFRKNSIRAKV